MVKTNYMICIRFSIMQIENILYDQLLIKVPKSNSLLIVATWNFGYF